MASARDLVFCTPELLESILLHLSPTHLLLAQQISPLFRTTIVSSPKLQQRVFFRPDLTRHPKQWTINPLLRQHFFPWFVMPQDRFSSRNYDILKRMDWVSSLRSAFLCKEASWRRMLLMQPSPKELRVVRWTHGQGGDGEELAMVSFPNHAVTMGRLYDITESFLRNQHGSFPSFGLGFDDSDTGPAITLYLSMTMQCCRNDERIDAVLRSQDVDTGFRLSFKVEEGSGVAKKEPHGRLDITWRTDLTVERGGVEVYEWNEWLRKRAPISDLSSDVR